MRRKEIIFAVLWFAFAAAISFSSQRVLWNLTTTAATDDPKGFSSPNLLTHKINFNNFSRLQTSPKNIYVLGERNSGTNYVARILRNSFDPPNKPDPSRTHEFFSSEIPVLLHKHMFRHTLLNETELMEIYNRTDILWILAVRRPCDWAEGMYRLPWHMCPPKNISSGCPGEFIGFEHKETLKQYTLQEFFEMEWGDWPESSNFRNLSFVGNEFIYRNIFQLRRHKLRLMKQITNTVPRNVKIARLHEIERSPEAFIQSLILEFDLKRKEGPYERASQKMHVEKCFKRDEWEIAQREIDWGLEGEFGYTFLDCHMCYNPNASDSPGFVFNFPKKNQPRDLIES
mmetsp:Transcript_31121/g.64052  ORF Transcript_31121/g.64052 Transcript_31121/m.64052 type:complete len:343 (-) Transcript_31121:85-1113(-)